ncbi:MAG: VOC family protein [Promicromonosporaceae bacterium]|nr:VOC family protein [Promicromonosporaceae bacterium]
MITLNPSLGFENQTREALEFYREALGGQIHLVTYADYAAADPSAEVAKEHHDRIVHGVLLTEFGQRIIAADTLEPAPKTPAVTLSIWGSPEDVDTLRAAFTRLAVGGAVTVAFDVASWAADETWGALTDKFGVYWEFGTHPAGSYL